MRKKKPFHDPAPDIHDFPGVPESTFDLVNQYGTYNIQPTSHTENLFPLIGPELPERWRTMRLGKDDLEDLKRKSAVQTHLGRAHLRPPLMRFSLAGCVEIW